jgi:hypothetical protein
MLIFSNPGLIDLAAVTTLGVSVKQPGSFGRFGTGMKFAVATVLRGGGSVTLWRGTERFDFITEPVTIRGVEFQKVKLLPRSVQTTTDDGGLYTVPQQPLDLCITTQLGRDWQPWMVLRELGCNALDEHGEFDDGGEFSNNPAREDSTTIVVEWPDLDEAYRDRGNLFLTGDSLLSTANLRILPGTSDHLFYRGIRVYKLERPSVLTYDILAQQYLTEDRTLGSSYIADRIVQDTLLTTDNQMLASHALTAANESYEAHLDYQACSYGLRPSREWLDAAVGAREAGKLNNSSARKLLMRYMRESAEETSIIGSYRRALTDRFQYAIDILSDLGMKFDPNQKFIEVLELPSESMMTMLENGRVYYVPALNQLKAREIVAELFLRWAEINVQGFEQEDMATLLAPFVLGRSEILRMDEQLIAEDESMQSGEEVKEAVQP